MLQCCYVSGCKERLPLSASQISLLDTSWAEIKTRIEHHGIEAFMDLFNTHPDAVNSFLKFEKPEIDDCKLEMTLKAHSIRITSIVEKCISRLRQPWLIADIMHKIGINHAVVEASRTFKVEEKYILYVARSYIEAIACRTSDIWTPEHTDAWRDFFNYLIHHMKNGIKSERRRRRALQDLMYLH